MEMGRRSGIIRTAFIAVATFYGLYPSPSLAADSDTRPSLSIDDVLKIQRLDRATLSPDGEWAALVIQRPAGPGEIYGRNSYEIDPSRADVVLVSARTGERLPITAGAGRAAGYWCATWSPDGERLAMLSTHADPGEPRGGDNVRLYIWERATKRLARAMPDGVPTQMRYGGPWQRLDFRGGADKGTLAHRCSEGEENAPFLWLDARRLLVAALPPGQVSALLDRYARPSRVAAEDFRSIRNGDVATGRAAGSGLARQRPQEGANQAILKIVDVATGAAETIATVPTYPFHGSLTITVAPDGKRIAILATTGRLQPEGGRKFPNALDDLWTTKNRLGFVDLRTRSPIRWADLPDDARYPMALYEWSPDSRQVLLRGRHDRYSSKTSLFAVSAREGAPVQLTSRLDGPRGFDDGFSVFWADSRRFIARLPGQEHAEREDWWLLDLAGRQVNLTRDVAQKPSAILRGPKDALLAVTAHGLLRLDLNKGTFLPVAKFEENSTLTLPQDRGRPADEFLISRSSGDRSYLRAVSTDGRFGPEIPSPGRDILDFDPEHKVVLASQRDESGDRVRAAFLSPRATRDVIRLNGHMAKPHWGQMQAIEYLGARGEKRKANIILPPDYQPGRRYPTLLWVYWGYEVRSLKGDPVTDRYMPGFYNLHLYAARGYVVVVPSMPMPKVDHAQAYLHLVDDVLPAVDKLVSLGITDEDRVGIFGQSGGGYTVAALLAQTDRFKAGVAIAGLTDLGSAIGEFDGMARGYAGIDHEKGINGDIVGRFGLVEPPSKDPEGYTRLSPITYVDQVNAPLLLLHGDLDSRGSSAQSERFFHGLYTAGKTAQIVRYGGESHSLAQSPANIRDVYSRILQWFDTYLQP